jgi:hypothetical protein
MNREDVSVVQRGRGCVPAGESELFTIRTPRERVDAEWFLRVRMSPETAIVCAVRFDRADLNTIANVSDGATALRDSMLSEAKNDCDYD